MTASAWVVNKDRSKVLMIYHNIYNSWSWLMDMRMERQIFGCCHSGGVKKLCIAHVYPVSEEIFFSGITDCGWSYQKGKYVSSHLHLNITLLEADPEEHLSIKEDENSGVAWFTPEEALEKSTEPWFVECVYKKLIKKTNLLKGVRMNENEVSTE